MLRRQERLRGLTIIEVLVIVVCLVALAGAILLPGLARSRARSSRINCANGMKQIGLSFRSWSLDNNGRFPMQVSVNSGGTMELVASGMVYPHFQVMSNELSTPKILLCPNDEKRTWATNFAAGMTDKHLSYFINVDAIEGDGSSLLSGDRNITNRAGPGSRLVSLTGSDTMGWTREMHAEKGFLGFGDGSVQAFRNGSTAAAVRVEPGKTNRLAVP